MTHEGEQTRSRPRVSLRLKLTLWIALISGVVQVTLAIIAILYVRATLARSSDERIQARARVLAEAVRLADCHVNDQDLARFTQDEPQYEFTERVALTLYEHDGSVIASTITPAPPAGRMGVLAMGPGLPSRVFRAALPAQDADDSAFPSRIVLRTVESRDGHSCVLLVAATDSTFRAMMGVAVRILLLTLPAGMLATAFAGWMIGGLATAPLERLRKITVSLAPDTLREPAPEKLAESRETAELERALADTRSKLRAAFQAQDRFIANVSHEIKTPIAVVLAEADTLPRDDLSARAVTFVQSTVEEMQRLGRIIESFLTLTKLKSGAAPHRPLPADMNAVVLEAIVECRKLAQQHRVELAPELAETDRALEVLGDAEQLQVMIVNLIRNAIRFSPEHHQIIVRVVDLETECAVTVRDFGRGVPAEIIDTLFDRFVQGPAESGRGHGLGLAIAQGVAELHGGKITVRNIAEGGCEFSVRLPLANPASPMTAASPQAVR